MKFFLNWQSYFIILTRFDFFLIESSEMKFEFVESNEIIRIKLKTYQIKILLQQLIPC